MHDNCSREMVKFLTICRFCQNKLICTKWRNCAQIMHLVVKSVNKYRYTLSTNPLWQSIRLIGMKRITKLAPKFAYIVTLFTIMAAMGFTGLYLAVGPDLPEVETIRQIRLQTPMSVYSKDGQLINEFGDIRRIPITLDQVPQDFINALLSTEDVRFYQHSGVDFKGVLRAIFKLASTGTKSQGASTITMLVARNYYLSREKRFSRKFTEMFVAWKLESALTKNEILEIFLNKIDFGHRSAGLGAASQVYYGKPLDKLSLAELAILAGIPKGQSVFNPISRPDKAKTRRNHVLGRMLSQGHITQAQFDQADAAPIKTYRHGAKTTVSAPYVAEMVHMDMIRRFGREAAHSDGLKIYTSLDPKLQSYAQDALKSSLLEYDRRHGYREVEQHRQLDDSIEQDERIAWIGDFTPIGQLIPALVINTDQDHADILLADGSYGKILLEDSLWAKKYVDENFRKFGKLTDINQIIVKGDLIRVLKTDRVVPSIKETNSEPTLTAENQPLENLAETDQLGQIDPLDQTAQPKQNTAIYLLSQVPDVNGGFVVLNPKNGAVEALAGGFDFSKNQFNMVTQARRQLGSNIKPFIYSSALEKGLTAATLINDSPIINWDSSADVFWRPENDSGKYRGPMRLRYALTWSVNTVSIRLIRKIGARYAKSYLEKIGFPGKHMKPYPSLALGSASFTPLEVATSYATLANGGYKVLPWYIERIEDNQGKILFEQQPVQVCTECEQIIAAQKEAELEMQLALEQQSNELANQSTVEQPDGQSEQTKDSAVDNSGELPLTNEENQITADTSEKAELTINPNKLIENLPLLPIAEEQIAPRVIEARNRYIVDNMLKDVIHRGTASRTLKNAKSSLLRRNDIAGKTGTTNESKDAWFSGYNSQYVASAWVGFVDHSKKLGKREFGARAALPVWRKFMEKALKGQPQFNLPRPDGIVDVKIDLSNGKLASAETKKSDFEVFRDDRVPTEYSETQSDDPFNTLDEEKKQESEEETIDDEIF